MRVRTTRITVVRSALRARGDICAGARDCRDEHAARVFYRRALAMAAKRKKRSIRCRVRCGAEERLPAVAHAKILGQEIFRCLHEGVHSPRAIIVSADRSACPVFKRHCLGYLDYIANKLRSPFLTVDAIIEVGKKIVVIRRSNPPFGWALPGGFVDYGESLEEAVKREAKEETGLSITGLQQFHTYSRPGRDPRFHTVGTVFVAQAQGVPRAGDDAAQARVINLSEVEGLDFAFDHKKILRDYRRHVRKTRNSRSG